MFTPHVVYLVLCVSITSLSRSQVYARWFFQCVYIHGYKMYISWLIIPWKYTTLMNNLMNKIASSHVHITWQYLRLYDMCDTLTSRIRVHIWVFILRKFSTLYGLIWVYMIINNSGFHPICILLKSIHLLQAWKVKTKCAIPTGIMTLLSYLSLCLQACLLLAGRIPSFYTLLCIGHQNKIFVVKEIN